MTTKLKAKDLQKGDRITTITGNVDILESNLVMEKYCLLKFESGLSFHRDIEEEIDIFRPTIKEHEINS